MIIRVGNMVSIKGVQAFGFVKEFLYYAQSKKTLASVEVHLKDGLHTETVIIDVEDIALYHSEKSRATRIYAHADDHYHAALMMADERLAV